MPDPSPAPRASSSWGRRSWRGLVLAVVLAIPLFTSGRWLDSGWMRDDHVHRLLFSASRADHDALFHFGYGQNPAAPLTTMFTFIDGGSGQQRMLDSGLLPWWVQERTQCSYLRPITALTHWVDFHVWPSQVRLMHLHSTLWLCLLAGLAFFLFQSVRGPGAFAAVAALLYACHGHATASSWLANRNALIYACFALGALVLFVRHRRSRSPVAAVGAYVCFALALLSAEGGVVILAYLLAYAALGDEGPVAGRLRSVVPFLGLTLVWYAAYKLSGFGALKCPGYTDPANDIAHFLRELPRDWWSMTVLAFGLPVPSSLLSTLWCVGLLCGAVGLTLRRRTARFWLAGSLLSMAPLVTTTPHLRHMIIPSVGAVALTAELVCWLAAWRPGGTRWAPGPRAGALVAAVLIVVAHGASIVIEDGRLVEAELSAERALYRVVALGNTPIPPGALVVLLRDPGEFHNFYAPVVRYWEGLQVPWQSLVLGPRAASGTLTRTGPNTFVLQPRNGYLLPKELAGTTLSRGGARIQVAAHEDGQMPRTVEFTFERPLDDPSVIWLYWDSPELRFFRCRPPALGESLEFGSKTRCQ